jgi:hypothetical protein
VGEKWPVNLAESSDFKDILRAANLRHGTDGFIFPSKEGVLRILFCPEKSAGFEPANLGTKGQHATPLDHRRRFGKWLPVGRR